MNAITSAILITWKRNGAYAQRLVADLTDEQWTAQPVRAAGDAGMGGGVGVGVGVVMNQPAWIYSHLNVYTPICTAMLRGRKFEDPIEHRFGQKSEVSLDPGAYAAPGVLLEEYRALHAAAERALVEAAEAITDAPNPLERWRAVHPTIGDMLVTLMVKHESGHLGQLSAWRRAMGLGRVPM